MTTNEERARLDRIAVRAFLDDVISSLSSYPDNDQKHYPGSQTQVDEKDWDGSTDSVTFYIVTGTEFKEWLADLQPPRGGIHLSPKGSKIPTGWYAECDDHGVIAEDFMTTEGHDLVVRAWYEHDKVEHGGDGNIPGHMIIGRATKGFTPNFHT